MPGELSRQHIYGYALLILSGMIWGTEGIMAKLCYANGFTVLSVLSLRYLATLPVFALVIKGQRATLTPPRELLKPITLIALNSVFGISMLFIALALLPATLAILFFYAYPSFTSLLHVLLKRGALGSARIAALLISAVGLLLLYWSSVDGLSALGMACAICSAALQAIKLFQMASVLPNISAARLNFFTSAITAAAIGLFWLIHDGLAGPGLGLAAITPVGWLYMLILGMAVTVFGNLFMTTGIHYVGAVDTSLVLLLEPLTTAVLAFLIFGDTLSPWQILGGVLILLAVALPAAVNIRRAPAREEQSHEAS